MQTSLLCEKTYRCTNAKTYVFSDSVFCVGKMGNDCIATWKSKIKWYSEKQSLQGYESNRRDADGMPTEFEQKVYPGITVLGFLETIQSVMPDL